MKRHITLVLLLLALGLSACASAAPAAGPPNQMVAEPVPEAPSVAGNTGLDAGKAGEVPGDPNQPGQSSSSNAERLVIKTASLTLQVENVRDAEAAIRARVAELKGYVVGVQSNGADDDLVIDMTFRVPADQFDAALSGVQGLAKKVLSRTLGGEDVTEEFVDLGSRMRTLEATRDRLLTLLEKAQTVEDALAVNQALTDIQGQVEQIQGRMKYLSQSAALSTITVSLRPVPPIPPLVDEGSWQPFRVLNKAARDLIEFGQGLAELAIVLLVWVPVWAPILLLLRWGWRKIRGTGKPKAPPTTPPVAPPAAPTAE